MNMPHTISAILVATALGFSVSSCQADETSAPTNAQIEDLQRQIRTLQKELDELGSTDSASGRQRLMQQNWQSMLDYMQEMQSMPWMMGGPDNNGRHMMGPGMMGRGMMGWRHAGDWMMGCPMMGGPGGGWALPPDVDTEEYRSQMRENMQRMHDQMAQVWSTTDPAERERLLQEHWQDMYQSMQTMRGMGWMWGGAMPGGESASQLPGADAQGAKLVSRYCTQCHAQPSPQLHTASEWKAVMSRMKLNMENLKKANWRGVKIPSDAETQSIIDYLQKYARQ
jgi:hypothetical protein